MEPLEEPPTHATDRLLEILADEHCRRVLHYFRQQSTDVGTLDDLTAFVFARCDDGGETIRVRLHHVTLPRLAGADLLEYDARSHAIRYRGGSPAVDAWLNHVVERGADVRVPK
ncbi:DUF7344 domain-containing protein [Halorussus sp. AFM4]|uniref:DUF7344 domain-containing protein n=1 Tax=Halorussus sp. AFM4 TaxID=3421651 RepID=UPI003EB8FEE8